ncbi:FprA family A-type flavoprotein [Candidatus Bathyarchaeota archaeon]|nr:FprA family A-type flavoprotein [Candidatus Bathyarchaeota archaeon]
MKALVLYHSQQYGNTGKMAEAVAEGLKEAGCKVVMFNTDEDRFDVTTFPHFDCSAFGTPDYFSYVAGGVKTFMDDWYIHRHDEGMTGKPMALFYSHGGGGRVREPFVKLLERVGNLVGEPVSSSGAPSEAVFKKCRELGKRLAEAAK